MLRRLHLLMATAVTSLLLAAAHAEPTTPGAIGVPHSATTSAQCQKLDVTVLPFTYESDFSQDMAQVTQLQRTHQAFGFNGKSIGMALVQTSHQVSLQVQDSDDEGCRVFRVQVGFSQGQLLVAREFPPGTCAFSYLLKHETGHVDIYRDFLESRLPHLIAQATPALLDQLQRQDLFDASATVRRQMEGLLAGVKARQNQHDLDADQFDHTDRICGGYILRTLRQML